MSPDHMIPALWLRLAVIIAFALWVFAQGMWVVGAIAITLGSITVAQVIAAYQRREEKKAAP
ncbi:hypothetical protein H7347_03155 [Corynebacterium sp. zg-331]|uniref:hypothetical protein n=1 Tax=unclassified Corynebacterium TaxID=2624378 RepID=UPI00128BE678|nr:MULTISPECIES: hypothetical protein [unclassified Corynebacterium]MBC3185582.1 hypothetical protein [Corynebacterium sp. zg-331]MPV52076.1 hypothetical protein [Corynebacterium sp. zg331]